MPNTPKTTRDRNQTTVRHLRVPDELWADACTKAGEDGIGPAEMFRALLRSYVRGEVTI